MKHIHLPAFFLILFFFFIGVPGTDAQKRAAKKRTPAKTESSAEMKKRQKATQREIQETKRKIASNEKSVSQGLADLSRIDADIKVTQKKVSDLAGQVGTLDRSINALTVQIQDNERELKHLRDNYLVSVKKIRKSKGSRSNLSFIFSSKNFSQALRRIRYLRQFNAWRDRQTKIIQKKNAELKEQNLRLAQAKNDKSRTLGEQRQAQATLRNQFARQDALVAELRVQGDRLRAHLAKKQAEANDLKNSIAAVIAAEQQREQQRRQAEQQRIAEQKRIQAERAEAERKAKAEAEARRKASEKQDMTASTSLKSSEKTTKKKPVKEKTKPAKEEKEKLKKNESNRTYADARRREARRQRKGDSDNQAKSPVQTPSKGESASEAPVRAAVTTGGFDKAKGSLPKPVSGAFRIVSQFGRHPLPELPDVVYDNPGIDAEVSAGASAQAVFAGRVSGIYRLPGYNTVVIVSHGDYYTVYGNLETTSVKSGQNVKQYQTIGKVANSDDSGRPSIHFEIWKNRDKLNPADWIR